jgi:deazaflavin-dependent oxidoreductase (nitroreductase family)
MNASRLGLADGSLSRVEQLKLSIHRALDKHLSPLGVWVMRRSRGAVTKAWKVNALVLTTQGRRSGRKRRVVLQYFPDGNSMVVVAANDGGNTHPGWFFNLTAAPSAAVELDGKTLGVHASELDQDEAMQWWERILEIAPSYAQYRRATTRAFPILRLTPTDVNAPAA